MHEPRCGGNLHFRGDTRYMGLDGGVKGAPFIHDFLVGGTDRGTPWLGSATPNCSSIVSIGGDDGALCALGCAAGCGD